MSNLVTVLLFQQYEEDIVEPETMSLSTLRNVRDVTYAKLAGAKSMLGNFSYKTTTRAKKDPLTKKEIDALKKILFKSSKYTQRLPTPHRKEERPLYCGMTMKQFTLFIESCMNTGLYQWLKDKPEDQINERKKWYNPLSPKENKVEPYQGVNAHEFNTHFIKPLTQGTGKGVALNMQDGPGLVAEVMLSHSWAEDIEDILKLLKGNYKQKLANGKIFDENTVVWFCCFAQDQNGDSPDKGGMTVAEQVLESPFLQVITATHIRDVIALHTTADDMFSRMWCVEELRVAIMQRRCIHFLATPYYVNRYISMGRDNDLIISSDPELKAKSDPNQQLPPLSLKQDCAAAQGTDIDDVKKYIEDTITFEYLNIYLYYMRILLLKGYLKDVENLIENDPKAKDVPAAKYAAFLPYPDDRVKEEIAKYFAGNDLQYHLNLTPTIGGNNILCPLQLKDMKNESEITNYYARDAIINENNPEASDADAGSSGAGMHAAAPKSIDIGPRSRGQRPQDTSTAEIVDALNGLQNAVTGLTQAVSDLQRVVEVNAPRPMPDNLNGDNDRVVWV